MIQRKDQYNMKKSTRLMKLMFVAIAAAAMAAPAMSFSSYAVAPVNDAGALYKAKCASCHAADGSGNTAMGKKLNLRDLRSKEVQSQSDDQLYNIIAKGKGKMPPYEKSLGADKCRQLVAYTRSLAK
jgi:mono/diheme cytochrome c family protein